MRTWLGSALVVLPLALAAILYVPVPDGMANPWKSQLQLVPFKLVTVIINVLEPFLGPNIRLGASRYAFDLAQKTKVKLKFPRLKVSNETFNGIGVRLYKPSDLPPDSPGVIYLHAGGWVLPGGVGFDMRARKLADDLNVVVVGVPYRRAPEYPFPVPFEDCLTATMYFISHAADYGVNPSRVALVGESAGGNLAAAVAISLRDQEFVPAPKLQVLVYPPVQPINFLTPSYVKHAHSVILSRRSMASCWLWYAFGHVTNVETFLENNHTSPEVKASIQTRFMNTEYLPEGVLSPDYVIPRTDVGNRTLWSKIKTLFLNPLFAPLLADDLSRLPLTYVITVEHDVLRDEGVWFARRLVEAGVTTYHRHILNGFHGILGFERLEESKRVFNDIKSFIQGHL